MRNLLIALLFVSTSLFAQRDSVISGIKFHLVAATDTGTSWIQQKIVKKGVTKFGGVYYEFYAGGKLKTKGYYKRGKRTGKWMYYYSSGKKSAEGYYDEGFKTELWMAYYESGVMSWKGNFFKNIRSGFWRYFYEDGKLKAMTRYRIKTESIAKKPKEATKGMSIRVNRVITYSISPADSLVEYYPDGKLRTRIIYGKEGGLTGTYDLYYENGKKNTHGEFIDGKRSGKWEFYCVDGTLLKIEAPSIINIPETKQEGSDVCGYVEMSPWMKWEVEIITP
jgi:antitoxin component YwqK of YwqJK toxin-antitoxin module